MPPRAGNRILHRRIFSRWRVAAVALICALCCSGPLFAQEEVPQIIPGERKIPTKKDLGPRAVALLQLSANGKASLVPVAIMINGKFWDAGAYKADPVPMALDSGNVYEVEQTGSSQGLFTVGGALHSNAVNSPMPWIATGSWVPAGSEKQSTGHRAESAPIGLDNVDAPPRLTRNSAPANAPTTTNKPAPASAPDSKSGSGDEPPRLSKPASSPESSPSPSTTSNSPSDSKGNSGSNQPGQSGSNPSSPNPSSPNPSGKNSSPDAQKKSDQASIPASDSDTPEANRPRLRRGKPAQSFADEDVPGYSKPGAKPFKTAANAAPTPAASDSSVKLIPAISDAHGPDPRPFTFEWLKDEEAQRQQQMLDLAKQQFQAHLKAQAKATITPTSQTHHASPRGSAAKLPEPVFENVKFTAYDLWVTNQPVFILSATAHLPPQPTQHEGTPGDLVYSVTVVAYPDIYNNLRKIYAGITDKYHLDITPRLDLIDAVDADGDGRGELIFRQTSDTGTGWIIYRATADTLWKMYDSLNPE